MAHGSCCGVLKTYIDTLAAVVAVQLDSPTWRPNDVYSAPTCRPFKSHLAPGELPVGAGGAQEAQVEPKSAQKAPRWAAEAVQRPKVEPKTPPRGPKVSPRDAQKYPESCHKAVQEHLESTTGNLLNLRSRLHGSVILRGRGALERHLDAKLEV